MPRLLRFLKLQDIYTVVRLLKNSTALEVRLKDKDLGFKSGSKFKSRKIYPHRYRPSHFLLAPDMHVLNDTCRVRATRSTLLFF